MKKYTLVIIIVAIIAVSGLVLALCLGRSGKHRVADHGSDDSMTSAEDGIPKVKTPESLTAYFAERMEALAALLDDCNRSNADAMAEKAEKLIARLKETQAALEKMEHDNPEGMENVFKNQELQQKLATALHHLLSSVERLEMQQFYDSSALEKALSELHEKA